MANERIEIDIVLNDGSVAKGFAAVNKEAQKTQSILSNAFSVFGGLQLNQAFNQLSNSLKGLFSEAIAEANAGQEAINNLATSFRNAGIAGEDAITGFQEFASVVQKNTTLADDQIISLGALAANYAKTSDQAIQLTAAAIELSAATGTDLNSAVEQLGGTLNGVSGRLGKIVPGLKGLSEEALRSGQALEIVLERFGGTATSKINTYAGSIAQLKNEFSDFLEGLGNLIIRSPALTAVFTEVANIFREFASSLDGITKSNKDVLGPIIAQGIQFGISFNNFVIRPLEITKNLFSVVFNVAKQFFDFFLSGLGRIAGAAGKLISFFDSKNSIADALFTFQESTAEVYEAQVKATAEAGAKAFDTGFADGVDKTLERVKAAVQSASKELLPEVPKVPGGGGGRGNVILPPIDKELLDYQRALGQIKGEAIILRNELELIGQSDLVGGFKAQLELLPDALAIANSSTQTQVKAQLEQLKVIRDEILAISEQIGQAINNGLANAVSQGVQTVIDSLLTGKNAFKSFLGTVLGIFGDLAIQIGTTLVSIGIGIDSIKLSLATLSGGLAIAAGVALIAVGSLLKGLSGSLGGRATAPGSSVTSPGAPATPVSGISDNIDRQQQASIVINGDLLDADSTGLRIANILKEQGFANAVIA